MNEKKTNTKGIILCENINPEWASLPYFSYNLVKELSYLMDITLVTQIRNKKTLDKYKDQISCEIIYIDTEVVASKFYKISEKLKKIKIGGWMTNMAMKFIPNIIFEKKAYEVLKQRISTGEFSFAARIAPVSPTIPSVFHRKIEIPFFIGPLNGSLPWPKQFHTEIKKEGELILKLRNLYKILPYSSQSLSKSKKILYAFDHVLKDINQPKEKLIKYDELGVTSDFILNTENRKYKTDKLNYIFVGRLVPYKNADVAIKAFSQSKAIENGSTLEIIGDGPERKYLEDLVGKLKISDSVVFTGWLNQESIKEKLVSSDVFLFPTIREVGGNVILEAMGCGLVCIVPNYGGPSELVNESNGIKITLTNKENLINDYTYEINKLEEHKELIEKIGTTAYLFVKKNYTWKAKAEHLYTIYTENL